MNHADSVLVRRAAELAVSGLLSWVRETGPEAAERMAVGRRDLVRELLPRHEALLDGYLRGEGAFLRPLLTRSLFTLRDGLVDTVIDLARGEPELEALTRHEPWLRDNLTRAANLLAMRLSGR